MKDFCSNVISKKIIIHSKSRHPLITINRYVLTIKELIHIIPDIHQSEENTMTPWRLLLDIAELFSCGHSY